MNKKFGMLGLVCMALVATSAAYGAYFALPSATPPLTGLETLPMDTNKPQGGQPQTEIATLAQVLTGSSTDVTNATSFTSTAAQWVNGAQTRIRLTGAPATAQNITTPTAAALIAALPSGSAVGYTWLVKIVNVGGTSSGVWTTVAGSGVTLAGNVTVQVTSSRTFLVTWATATTVTVADYGN